MHGPLQTLVYLRWPCHEISLRMCFAIIKIRHRYILYSVFAAEARGGLMA